MERIQTIRGRRIGAAEISEIQHFVEENSQRNRSWLSRELCRRWEWRQANGRVKEVACRELLLRLERQGYLRLPPRQREGSNDKRQGSWVSYTGKSGVFLPRGFSHDPLEGQLGDYGKAQFQLMLSRSERKFWNILIERYHYLGYRPVAGPSLKYLIYLKGYVVGCLGWGAAVWKLTLRDAYIGWDPSSMERHLNSVVNNVRFLILPWVKVGIVSPPSASRQAWIPPGYARYQGLACNRSQSRTAGPSEGYSCYSRSELWVWARY